jgi:hypothetical protein
MYFKLKLFLNILLLFTSVNIYSQVNSAKFQAPTNNLWIGNYNKIKIGNKLYWDAQLHVRTIQSNKVAIVGQMAQIYNRHGISYVPNNKISITAGPVLRIDFSPDPSNKSLKKIILEPRIWHEYVFSMPFNRFNLYHRIRIEHRWSTGFREDSKWIFRNRWRYFIFAMIPINNNKLVPKTFYFNPGIELIMQSGKPVGGSAIDDLRISPQFGYIVNSNMKYSGGLMWTTGQSLSDPLEFRARWIIRLNAYISLDFRKLENKVPETRIFD